MQMVAGRFVNAYSTNDWMLGIAFRARYAQWVIDLVEPLFRPEVHILDQNKGSIMLSICLLQLYYAESLFLVDFHNVN